jgi:hypothetical protein
LSRNKDRLGGSQDITTGANSPVSHPPTSVPQQAFSFVVPTTFVDLPSKGNYYPPGHALHKQDTIEIKHMTAKEEDILTSRSLLKKGVALDRVIQNLVIDNSINTEHLLIGDRNAIIIAARIAAYGADYETNINCPACGTSQNYCFDLIDANTTESEISDTMGVADNGNGTFNVTLPVTEIPVTFRLLTGADEKTLIGNTKKNNKKTANRGLENNITNYLKAILIAVDGNTTQQAKNYLIDNLPSMDSRHLRLAHRMATPNVELSETFACSECDFEQEMEVPLTSDFFWPKR